MLPAPAALSAIDEFGASAGPKNPRQWPCVLRLVAQAGQRDAEHRRQGQPQVIEGPVPGTAVLGRQRSALNLQERPTVQLGVLSTEHDDRHVLLIRIVRARHLGHVDDDGVVDQHVAVDVRGRRELLQHRRRRRRVELVDLTQPALCRRVTGLGDGVVRRRRQVAEDRRSLERARELHPAGPGSPHEGRNPDQIAS